MQTPDDVINALKKLDEQYTLAFANITNGYMSKSIRQMTAGHNELKRCKAEVDKVKKDSKDIYLKASEEDKKRITEQAQIVDNKVNEFGTGIKDILKSSFGL